MEEVQVNFKKFEAQTSLFTPLLEEGYTTIRIINRPFSEEVILSCSREWGVLNWNRYMKEFDVDSNYDYNAEMLNHTDTLALYERAGLTHYLKNICNEAQKSGFERIEAWALQDQDIKFFHVVDSSYSGLKNRYHSIRIGATRRYDPEVYEHEVIMEGLRMARAMSLKSAAASLPFGGCSNIIIAPPFDLDNEASMGFLAYSIDRTRSLTGPDMGLTPSIVDVINQRYTPNLRGGSQSSVGPGGPLTAYGVMLALKVACEYVFGSPSTSGLTAAIMGVGSVGRAMCELLLAEGAFLVVADIREEPIKKLVHDYPASKGFKIKTVHPGEILRQEVDVLVPTSIGAIIDEALIPQLKCKIILGSANNVLVADGKEDEVKLAALLHHRGILYQVEWVHNLGGILSAVEGYISGDRASASDVKRRIEQIIPAAARKYIELATRRGSFPTAIAYEEIANLLVSRQKNSL